MATIRQRSSWRVPTDLKLKGNEEPFTIQVTFDTEGLYGKVVASRQIVIHQE